MYNKITLGQTAFRPCSDGGRGRGLAAQHILPVPGGAGGGGAGRARPDQHELRAGGRGPAHESSGSELKKFRESAKLDVS